MPVKKAVPVSSSQPLAEARAQIDQIDGVIHDMLRERVEVVERVRGIKGKQPIYIRPGREAQMLRALMARPQGKIPAGIVLRLWREIISSATLLESGGFKVGVYAPPKGPDLWDMAHEHYGFFTPFVEYPTAKAAIKALMDKKISVAVVPPPAQDEADGWWDLLAAQKKNDITVFQSMPFDKMKGVKRTFRNSLPEGLIVGALYPELTGDDRSILALECVHVPEAEIKRLLGKAGYKVRSFVSKSGGRAASAPTSYCVEVEGYVSRNDTRLGRIKAMLGSRLKKLVPLGGYPAPLKNAGKRAG